MIYQKKNWGHRTSKLVKSRQSSSNGHLPYHLLILWLSARGRAWRGMWICVRSKDAQKQLARTSLSLRGFHFAQTWTVEHKPLRIFGESISTVHLNIRVEVMNITWKIFRLNITCCWPASGFRRLSQASTISCLELINWVWSIRPGLPATLDGSATATRYAAWKHSNYTFRIEHSSRLNTC